MLSEAIYSGMLGATELVKFYQKANEAEIKEFEELLFKKKDVKGALSIVQKTLKLSDRDIETWLASMKVAERLENIRTKLRMISERKKSQ